MLYSASPRLAHTTGQYHQVKVVGTNFIKMLKIQIVIIHQNTCTLAHTGTLLLIIIDLAIISVFGHSIEIMMGISNK